MKIKFFSPIIDYFQGVVQEGKKISFPNRRETIHNSIVVIVSIIVGAAFLALLDFLVVSLWQKIIV